MFLSVSDLLSGCEFETCVYVTHFHSLSERVRLFPHSFWTESHNLFSLSSHIQTLSASLQDYSRGCYFGVMPPGAYTAAAGSRVDAVGRVHWAGTETSASWYGCISASDPLVCMSFMSFRFFLSLSLCVSALSCGSLYVFLSVDLSVCLFMFRCVRLSLCVSIHFVSFPFSVSLCDSY